MIIKGQFRDVLTGPGTPGTIKDFGWRNNTIVQDYGRFLAALMRKRVSCGIDYMAVGSGSPGHDEFKTRVETFFRANMDKPDQPYYEPQNRSWWVWAKKIADNDIEYLDAQGEKSALITNTLGIDVKFKTNEPAPGTMVFKEFALIGTDKDNAPNSNRVNQLFFINYVSHGAITKDTKMTLSRSVKLTFPVIEETVGS